MGDHAVIISASNAGARMSQIFTNQFVTSVLLSLAASSRLQLPLADQSARSLSVLRIIPGMDLNCGSYLKRYAYRKKIQSVYRLM